MTQTQEQTKPTTEINRSQFDNERWLLITASQEGDTHYGANRDHNARIVRDTDPQVLLAYTNANVGAQIVDEHNRIIRERSTRAA